MEFDANRAKRPFHFYVQVGRWLAQEWRAYKTRQVLRRLDDAQLRDIGLRRSDCE